MVLLRSRLAPASAAGHSSCALHPAARRGGIAETGLATDRLSLATRGAAGENKAHERRSIARNWPISCGAAGSGSTPAVGRAAAARPQADTGAAAGGRRPAGRDLGGLLRALGAAARRRPSEQVISALAGALRLTEDECDYLHRLAGYRTWGRSTSAAARLPGPAARPRPARGRARAGASATAARSSRATPWPRRCSARPRCRAAPGTRSGGCSPTGVRAAHPRGPAAGPHGQPRRRPARHPRPPPARRGGQRAHPRPARGQRRVPRAVGTARRRGHAQLREDDPAPARSARSRWPARCCWTPPESSRSFSTPRSQARTPPRSSNCCACSAGRSSPSCGKCADRSRLVATGCRGE